MVSVRLFKMPFRTNHFNKNQIVWVQMLTGNLAAKVRGKFRGNGRYVSAWVSWDRKNALMPIFKTIGVDEIFANRHKLEKVTE